MRQLLAVALATTLAVGVAGCTQVRNPATGELQYTSLTPADEQKLGRQEHPKALQEFGVRVQRAPAHLPEYAEELEAMLIADADGDRDRDYAAQYCSPERNNELLVRLAEYDELVTRLDAALLQSGQQLQRAIPQRGKCHARLVILTVDEKDCPVPITG